MPNINDFNNKKTKKKIYNLDAGKIETNITRQNIEKSYNIDSANGTEAYYSNRYGWTLRKIIK